MKDDPSLSRRDILAAGIAVAAMPSLAVAGTPLFEPTPEIPDFDDEDPTISNDEGPFFTPKSPERKSLREKDTKGTVLVVTGIVVNRKGEPVAGALLDFWQANDAGEYDNKGYKLRGHQFTDDKGQFRLETIVPGIYPGRSRHIHVKVQAKDKPVLTTQIFMPTDPLQRADGLFRKQLVMKAETPKKEDGGQATSFRFVLNFT